jgi:hypothetical protein
MSKFMSHINCFPRMRLSSLQNKVGYAKFGLQEPQCFPEIYSFSADPAQMSYMISGSCLE